MIDLHNRLLYLRYLDVVSTDGNWWYQNSFTEELVGCFYPFWRGHLRKAWHYIVVPPIVAAAKRIQYEEALKKENARNNNSPNDVNEDDNDDPPYIDYNRATQEFLRRLFTEFIGILILTAVTGSTLLEARLGLISISSAAFSVGLTKLFLIYTLGGISGAHFNPVVTIGFAMRLIFPWIWVPFYCLAQFVGSIIGGLIIRALFGGQYASLGTNSVNTVTSTVANAFKWEIFLTFCLLFVTLQTATKASVIGSPAAISVFAVLSASAQIGASKSTSSMNPFRTLGPSIINNSPDDRHSLWIYIVGPLLGMLVAYFIVSFIQGFRPKRNEITLAHGAEVDVVPVQSARK